jgi:protein O-mannosyl-transferase
MDLSRIQNEHKLLLAPLLLAICCFVNTLGHQFVYDDRFQIVEAAPVLQDFSRENLARLFDRDVWGFFCQQLSWESKTRTAYYRPLFGLFVMINHSFAGLDPRLWHLTSILLHATAAILAYWLLLASLRAGEISTQDREKRWIAAIGASLFAVHPAQTESVAWVAAYVDALSAIFIFGALLAYLRARRDSARIDSVWLSLSSLAYLLALLTKESAIVVPAIIALYELFIFRPGEGESRLKRLRPTLLSSLPFVILTLGYFALRIAIFGAVRPGAGSVDFPEMSGVSRLVNLLTLPSILLKYIEIIVWPFSLNPMYAVKYVQTLELRNFFLPSLALIALGLIALAAAYRSRLTRIGLVWLVIPLLPVLDTRSFKPEDLVHDRYLYISLLGAGLLFAGALRQFNRLLGRSNGAGKESGAIEVKNENALRPSTLLVAGTVLIMLSAVTLKQNLVWADEWQLWNTASENVSDSCIVNLELGRLNEEAEHSAEALTFYEAARRTCPDSISVHYKLGLLYGKTGRLDLAETAFQRMAELSSYRMISSTAYFNLGIIYEKQGDLGRAIDHYQKGLSLNPESKNATQVRQIIDELTAKLSQGDIR